MSGEPAFHANLVRGSIVRAMIDGRTKGKLLTMIMESANKAPVLIKRGSKLELVGLLDKVRKRNASSG